MRQQIQDHVQQNASTLQYQTYAMKAQHQYIQNLTRSNNSLKAKISLLECKLAQGEEDPLIEQFGGSAFPVESRTANLDTEQQPMQDMDLYSVGLIGESNKDADQPYS